MKRNQKEGFTLTEAVITMGVVGVIAALLIPLANRFRPDPVKVQYLQTYDAITYVAKELANNDLLFPANADNLTRPFIGNANAPLIFCREFISGVNAPAGTQCESELGNITSNFTTNNGIAWTINITHNDVEDRFIANVDTWLNGNRLDNSQHFRFVIGGDGQTYPNDNQGNAYLATRSSWRNSTYELNRYQPDLDLTEIALGQNEIVIDPGVIPDDNNNNNDDDNIDDNNNNNNNNNDDDDNDNNNIGGPSEFEGIIIEGDEDDPLKPPADDIPDDNTNDDTTIENNTGDTIGGGIGDIVDFQQKQDGEATLKDNADKLDTVSGAEAAERCRNGETEYCGAAGGVNKGTISGSDR